MKRCEKAITLPDPFMLEQCVLDAGHDGDHKAILEWDDDDIESGDPS